MNSVGSVPVKARRRRPKSARLEVSRDHAKGQTSSELKKHFRCNFHNKHPNVNVSITLGTKNLNLVRIGTRVMQHLRPLHFLALHLCYEAPVRCAAYNSIRCVRQFSASRPRLAKPLDRKRIRRAVENLSDIPEDIGYLGNSIQRRLRLIQKP